jgi:hypothetical protein
VNVLKNFQVSPKPTRSLFFLRKMQFKLTTTMAFSMLATRRGIAAFTTRASSTRAFATFRPSATTFAAEEGQAEVILVGCGAPNRGMGWYHAIQMLEKK